MRVLRWFGRSGLIAPDDVGEMRAPRSRPAQQLLLPGCHGVQSPSKATAHDRAGPERLLRYCGRPLYVLLVERCRRLLPRRRGPLAAGPVLLSADSCNPCGDRKALPASSIECPLSAGHPGLLGRGSVTAERVFLPPLTRTAGGGFGRYAVSGHSSNDPEEVPQSGRCAAISRRRFHPVAIRELPLRQQAVPDPWMQRPALR